MSCDAPSPGGNLYCIREPHDDEGHVWRHPTAGGDSQEDTMEEK